MKPEGRMGGPAAAMSPESVGRVVPAFRQVRRLPAAFLHTSQEEACSLSVITPLASDCAVMNYSGASADEQNQPDAGDAIVAQGEDAARGASSTGATSRGTCSTVPVSGQVVR